MSKEKIDLSVVVITRNEEEMIGDCLKSVIASADLAVSKGIIETYEIIHVDSASTDRTVEIARKYPVKILQLPASWPLSASAGLYTGYKNAKGKFFMPVGGDMIMKKNWFSKALPAIMTDKSLGAVTGFEEEYLEGDGYFKRAIMEGIEASRSPEFVEEAGTAVYRMKVLKKVGGYNPFLKGAEDTDLSYRILTEGYKIKRLTDTSTVHYWFKKEGKINYIQTLRSTWTWSYGDGQIMRYGLFGGKYMRRQKSKYFRARHIWTYFSFMVMVAVAGLNLLMFSFGTQFTAAVTIFDAVCLLALVLSLKKRSWDKKYILDALNNIPYYLIRNTGFVKGYMRKPEAIERYPTDVKVIKEG
jgi:glycosyltransferase involved in cell wall biosynthesis